MHNDTRNNYNKNMPSQSQLEQQQQQPSTNPLHSNQYQQQQDQNNNAVVGQHHGSIQSSKPAEDEFSEMNSVWDELSHQQTREIEQHQYRMTQQHPPPSAFQNHHHHNLHYYNHNNHQLHHNQNNNPRFHTAMEVLSTAATAAATAARTSVQTVATSAHNVMREHDIPNSVHDYRMRIGQRINEVGIIPNGSGNEVDEEYNGPYSNPHARKIKGAGGGVVQPFYQPPSAIATEDSTFLEPLAEFGLHQSTINTNFISEEEGRDLYLHEDDDDDGGGGGSAVGLEQQQQHQDCGMTSSLLACDYGDSNEDGMMQHQQQQQQKQQNKTFILLDKFRLRPKRDGWGAVPNLDLFFTSLYNYYYHRGLGPIIGKGVGELISLFFTLWFSVFLFAYLDWSKLTKCTDEHSCEDYLYDYVIDRPFHKASLWNFLMILYILLFLAYGVVSILSFFSTIREALDAKYIYEDKLGISTRKLEGGAVEWYEIVEKILHLQRTGEYRIAIHGQDIKDELIIAQRIMRRENFMIAFFNRNMLDLTITLPFFGTLGGTTRLRVFYSKSLEWSIYFCVLSYMFNHKYQIRPAFYTDPLSLQRRFVVCGIAHAIFMPFLLAFMTLHFFMQNMYDFRSSQQYLGPRDWSSVAKWTFREFNELPHVFERRLGPSYEASEKYLKLFAPSSLVSSIGRIFVFLSGSLGAICIALAAINDAILLHVKLGNWNLLWYVGVLGVVFSVGKAMLPDGNHIPSYHHNLFAEMDSALAGVATHTHHYPDFWKKRGWDDLVKSAFSELYQFKAKLFIMEMVSVIVAPIILCFSLPKCALNICSLVQKIKIEVPGAGDHCGFSTFDFDLFEDENWEGQKIGVDVHPSQGDGATENHFRGRSGDVGDAKFQSSSRPKTRQGKMEKSFFNFKDVHPGWKCSSSGQDLIDRMETYQTQQALALTRERNHYVEAAARQLETLRKLEEENEKTKKMKTMKLQSIHENYISPLETNRARDKMPEEMNIQTGKISNEENHSSLESNPSNDENSANDGIQGGIPSTDLNVATAASVLHYNDIGLSTELQRVLNRSTLDPEASFAGTITGINDYLPSSSNIGESISRGDPGTNEMNRGRDLQRQYMWLERYHSQLKSNQE